MPHDLFEDIAGAVQDVWKKKLPNVTLIIANPDPRIQRQEDLEYPVAAISVIGIRIGTERRYGGVRDLEDKQEDGTVLLRKPPIPVDIDFQLDTATQSRSADWSLSQMIISVLGSTFQQTIKTGEGREIYLTKLADGYDAGDQLIADSLWRKAYRFRVQTWIDDDADVEKAYQIQEIILGLNDHEITYPEEE